jgi:hypothetical protein
MRRSASCLVALTLALAVTVPVLAQSVVSEADREAVRGVPDRWGFNIGGFWQSFDFNARLDAENGETGTDIDLETDLGLPENQTNIALSGYWRIADRHRLDLYYVGWDRDRSRTLERQIEWGDVIYDVGAVVKSETSANMLNIIYKYSFYNNGKVLFGVNGGISSVWSDITITGEGTVAGGGTASGVIAESKSTIFPVPVIGVHFEMALAKRLLWRAEGNFFAADISGYDGNVNEITTSIDYYFTRNVGVGAGFYNTNYRVEKESENGDGSGRVKLGWGGPTVYASFTF